LAGNPRMREGSNHEGGQSQVGGHPPTPEGPLLPRELPDAGIATAVGWLAAGPGFATVAVVDGVGRKYPLGTPACPNEMRPSPQPPSELSVELGAGAEAYRLQSWSHYRASFSVPVSAGDRQASPALRTGGLDQPESDHPEFEWIGLATCRTACRTNGGIETPQATMTTNGIFKVAFRSHGWGFASRA